jgi:hypothetical protein
VNIARLGGACRIPARRLLVYGIEMDDPMHGFWVIKTIPRGWVDVDPNKWRLEHWRKMEAQKVAVEIPHR